jgi:RNA polymerase sigma-70 factor (sigma-E family)
MNLEDDFSDFVAQAWPGLVRFAHLLTGDFHEAEDLVQTTLTKVHAQWSRIRHDGLHEGAYTRRALVNNNVSRLRRLRLVHVLGASADEGDRPHHPQVAGIDRDVENRLVVLAALASLTPNQRAAIVLRYYADMTDEKIAEAMDCALGTAKTHIRRGLQALKRHPALCGSVELYAS